MIELALKPQAIKFIKRLPPKHQRQIKTSILLLQHTPLPQDAKKLRGYDDYIRIDIGEYRVIYRYEAPLNLITIVLVGKRNDNHIYRIAKRTLN